MDEVVHYHKCPPSCDFIKYIDKKSLLTRSIPTDRYLWEWHGILTNSGDHVFLARLHHVIGDGMSLVKLVINLFDEELGVQAKETITEGQPDAAGGKGEGEGEEQGGKKVEPELGAKVKPGQEAKRGPQPQSGTQTAPVGAANVRKRRKQTCFQMGIYMVGIVVCFPFVVLSIIFMRSDPPNAFRKRFKEVPKKLVYAKAGKVSDVKFVGKVLGGTINDIITTALAGAMRRFQVELGEKGAPP